MSARRKAGAKRGARPTPFALMVAEARADHVRWRRLVERAAELLPSATVDPAAFYGMTALVAEASEASARVRRQARDAFLLVADLPAKRLLGLLRAEVTMELIQAHRLTNVPEVMAAYLRVRRAARKES